MADPIRQLSLSLQRRFEKSAEEIAAKVGPIVKAKIEAAVRNNQDPSGGAMAPAQDGRKMFQNFEVTLSTRGPNLKFTFQTPYFFHAAGISPGAPTRGMLPEPGDRIISDAIDEAIQEWKEELKK